MRKKNSNWPGSDHLALLLSLRIGEQIGHAVTILLHQAERTGNFNESIRDVVAESQTLIEINPLGFRFQVGFRDSWQENVSLHVVLHERLDPGIYQISVDIWAIFELSN